MTWFGIAVLWVSAVYHLLMGGIAVCATRFTRPAGKYLYGLTIPENLDPRTEYTWKPLGALAILLSAFCFRGIFLEDESYRRFLIDGLCGLYLARAMLRLLYRDLFGRAFQISLKRNLVNIVFNTVISIAMFFFSFK